MRFGTLAVVDVLGKPRRVREGLWRLPILWLGLLLAVILATINAATPASVCASTSGPLMAGTGSQVPGPGSGQWTGPENITANDTGYATVTLTQGGMFGYYHTYYLQGTNFGFNIPSGSTINGIQATIGRMTSGVPTGMRDDNLFIIKGGTIGGDDKSTEADWPNMVIGEASYGGATDNWGLTWTAEDINAADFGLALCVYNASWLYPYTAYVDYMQITVTYTLPGTTTTIATSGTPSTYGDSVTFTATVTAGAGTNTPSGTVTLKEGGATIGTGSLSGSGGVATVTFSTTTMTVGTHDNITAVYGGDSNFTGSTSSSISQTVNTRPLTITASGGTKTYGDTLTFAGTEFTTSGLVNSDTVTSVTLTSTGAGASAAAGAYSIVPSAAVGTGLSNYSISYVSGTLTVGQRALTVTANDRSKTYGDVVTFAGTEFTTSGLVNSDTVTSVTLASSGTGSAAAVGTYSIVPSAAAGTGLSNYSISYANGTLTVNQKALTITAYDNSKTYGNTLTFAGTEFTPAGLVNSDTVTSVTLTSSGAAATGAAGTHSIVASAAAGTGLSNYSISYINGTLTVNQKALTITADSRSKTYGDAVTFAGTEFTTSGLVNSDTVTSVTLTSSGAGAAATVAASPYSIVPSAAAGSGLANYTISYVNGSLTVGAKALTTTADNRSKTYGDTVTFAGTEFTASGLVNSDTVTSVTLTSSGAGATATVAGSPYSIVPSAASGSGLANYSISYVNGTLTVGAKSLTITADSRSKTYGDTVTFAGTEFTTSGLVNSDTVTSVTLTSSGAAATGAAGTHSIVASAAAGTGLSNYSISYVNGTLTVNQKALTITADNRSKTYGDAVTFAGTEFTTSGLVNSDTVTSVTLTSSGAGAAATVAASPYSIVPSAAAGSGLANYSISYVNGTLTVGAKSLTITADSRSKTYGDTATFAGTEFTTAGLVNSDSVTSVTLTSSGASADATVAASPYSIVPSAAAGTGLANYTISYVNGSLTAGAKSLTITADSRSKTYGDTVTFAGTEFATSGLVNSDTITSVTLTSSGASADATVAASPHSIVPSAAAGSGLANYTISYVNGSLTVSAKSLTITADSRSKTYGDTATFAGTEFTTAGLVNSDSVTSVTLTSSGASADATVAASPYSIVPSAAAGSGLANYSISYVNGTLTVNQKALTITADNRSKTYGDAVTFAGTEFTTSGLVNSDTVTSVTLTSSGAGAAATVAASPYSIVPSAAAGSGLANYTISYVNGSLTVGAKALTITADSRSKTYGDTVTFAGTEFTTSGLVNSDTVTSVTLTSSGASADASVAASPYSIVPSAAAGSGLANYTISYVNGTLTAGAKALTITADNRSKTYGNTVTFAGTEFSASGLVNSDSVTSVTLTSSGADAAAYAGSHSITPGSASGSGLANYTISYVNGTLTVNPKALTITATPNTRTYDGGTAAAAIPAVSGLVGSDTVSDLSETYDNKDAGTGKTLSVATYTINDGNSGSNYSVTLAADTTGVINQRDVTVTATGINKVYDGTTTANVTLSTDALGGDAVTASCAGASFADKNAGSGKTVSVTGISISGADAANYNLLNTTASTTADITQRDLTVTATGINKVYDGTTTATATLSTDAFGSDNVTASCAGASFADKNAGSGKAVSATGISISGTDAANYNLLNTTASATADVTQKALAITANDRGKTYGTAVTFAGTEFTASGLVTGDSADSVTLTSAGADASAPIGSYPIVPSAAAGTGLTNYSITYVNGTMTVSAKALTITADDGSKTYGDTLTFAGTEFTVIGLEAGDSVDSITLTSTGTASGADAGTYPIIPSDAVGTGLGDYTIIYVNGTLTAGQRDLTVTATGVNRVYDGTTNATVTLSTDALGGDTVTASCTGASFTDKNAGSGKAVSVTGISISGADAANYNLLSTTASTTADLTQRDLTVTATGSNRVYDGTTTATVALVTDAVGSDNVTASCTGASFADKNAGSGKAVSVTGISISGADAANYNLLNTTASTMAEITQRDLTVTATGVNRIYDGTTGATVTLSTDTLSGDTVTASYTGASFTDENAGSGKAVSVTGISISGADAANYNLLNNTASTTADITQKALTVTANDRGKTYGTTVTFAGTEFTTAGLVTGDSVDSLTLTSAGAAAAAGVGTYTIVPSAAAGTGLANYSITYVNGTLTVSAKALTITANNGGKTYGDTLTFTGTEFTVIGLVNSDTVTSITLTSTGAAAAAAAGTYTITPGNAAGSGLGGYTIAYVNGTLTVGQRDLTVTAIGVNRVYDGTTNAVVMLSTDALGGDAVTASCTSASFDDKNAGSGKAVSVTGISISGADAANYNLLNTTASTTADITQKALTITADGRGKAYRDTVTFAGTEFAAEGLIGSDTVDSVTLASPGAEATAAAGAYDIVPGAAAGTGLENYSITYVNGTLTVNKVSLTWTVTSSPASSAPGGTVTFTATVNDTEASGTVTFVDGDTVLGTAPLDHGVATLTISGISAGSHSVTVAYDGDTNFADGTSPAYIWQVDAASKSNWWLIVCIAAGVIGGFFCLLFFWRRRKPRQALAASAIGGTIEVAVDDAVAGNIPPAVVENEAGGDGEEAVAEVAVAGVGASAVLLEGEQTAEYSTEATLQEIRRVVETAAPDVAAHQKRVSELAGSIAGEMGLADRQIDGIRLAAELHDIGKVIEPEGAPAQTDKPPQADTSTIWDHPKVAFDLLKDVEFDWPIARIVAQHHERLDGSGYPYGIPGKDILLEARIIAVADAVDGMLSGRPSHPAMSPEEALAELADGDGSLYDSEVVQACQKVISQRGSEVELSQSHP